MTRFIVLLLFAVAPSATLTAQVVISQVYGGGGNSGAPFTNDFVELFNRGTAPAPLGGLSLQYASATGTGNFGANAGQLTTLPEVTLQPGQYFLVQQGGGSTGSPLPAADATGTINMSGSAGKVALVSGAESLGCNGGSTVCTAAQLARILDLVGYGNANFFEGAAAAGTLSNTTAALRAGNGCTDAGNNEADFSVAAPSPRNTTTAAFACSGSTTPTISISSVNRSEGNAGTTSFVFTVNLNQPAGASGVAFTINTQPGTTNPATPGADYVALANVSGSIPPGQQQAQVTVVVTGDVTPEPDETFHVVLTNITGAVPATVTGIGTIANDDLCGATGATLISAIQGAGLASGMTGAVVEVEGIVVGDFQGSSSLRGFYLQEEDADQDGLAVTSEGIFVFDSTFGVDVSKGDKVRVRGTVTEFSNLTEITAVTNLAVCSTGHTVTPTPVTLPLANAAQWEQYEGMLVTFRQPLVVTDNYGLERYGEVELATNRLPVPTHVALPGAPASAREDLNDRSRIILDDSTNVQNVYPTAYPQGGLSASNTLRVGDVISGEANTVSPFVAVVEEAFNTYRLRPVQPLYFVRRNPRPAPPQVKGRFRVASFNVLNYFTSLDTGAAVCGPMGGMDCRGANTSQEFERQRSKIIAALAALNADVVGLLEIENNAAASIQDLVDALNAATAPGRYSFINTGSIGTDAIKVALIYRTDRLKPASAFRVLDSSVDPRALDNYNRPALAQSFVPVQARFPSFEWFTVVVNHFKSKGSACADIGDPDTGDGQGNCNKTRLSMAQALSAWLATNPTGDPGPAWDRSILIIGDLNSYRLEDPIRHLGSAGYRDLIHRYGGLGAYSYVFEGESGYLDHALANRSMAVRVRGAAEWHINADEPVALDYNTEFKGNPAAYYAPDAFRSSDHDPLVVGLNPLLGDFNDDGQVDLKDLAELVRAIGQAADSLKDRLDLDQDGAITLNDLRLWQDYFADWKQGRR